MLLERRPTHVIFDLDGVLLDTEPVYTEATQRVVSEFGKVFDWSVKGDMIGRGPLDGAEYLVRALDLPISPEEYLARRRPITGELFPEVDEIPGASAFVRELERVGVPMAVATSGDRTSTDLKTTRHPWFSIFRSVICGDHPDIEQLKPAPDIFFVAAKALSAEPADCLVFEDSLAGVRAARAAGMQVIALPDPNMDRTRYGEAHGVIGGYDELSASAIGF